MNEVKRPKKPLFFYYTIVMLLILLGNLVLMPWMQQRQVEEVDYSKFISMTENKQIGKVEIKAQENEIISAVGAAAKAVADRDRAPAAKAHLLHRCFIVVSS